MMGEVIIWEFIWTGGLPHLSGLPHQPGVPHLRVNRSLVENVLQDFQQIAEM